MTRFRVERSTGPSCAALNGAELRFLRLEMEITQRNLAALVGTTRKAL